MKQKTTFEWCDPVSADEVRDIKTGIDQILRLQYIAKTIFPEDGCQRWVCTCRHDQGNHRYNHECYRCSCKKFEYLNNNNCDVECSIQRKIYEVV